MSKFGKSPLRIKIYITILCIAVLASLGTLCAFAEDETVPAEYGEFISATPDEVLDKLPSGALSQKVGEVEQAARELTSPARILGLLLETFEVGIKEMLPTLALILCTVILSALVSVIAKSVSSSLCVTVEACARICSFCAILGASALSVESVTEYFNGLFSSVAAFIPLSTVLYAMGGNFTAAGGGAVSLNLILGVCQFFCTQTAVPFFAVCLCLSLTSVFDGVGGGAGNALSATLRHWYLTSLSFVMMVISGAVGAQSLLSAKADNAAMKGMKFAASSFIPVSGGTVSSTLGTLAASVELLRSSVGTVGIAVIFLLLVPVVVELALLRLVLGIGGFCASVLGCSGEAKLLNELNSLYGYLEGVAVLSAVVFIVAFAIFACVAVPI